MAAAILAIAVVASGFVKLTLMDNAETAAGFEPARFVADADDSLPLP